MKDKEIKITEQLEELATFLMEFFPKDMKGESAIELAIKLLGELHGRRGATEEQGNDKTKT